MGSNASTHDAKEQRNEPYQFFHGHPLMSYIENPINLFCDEFASSLVDDNTSRTSKSESQFDPADQEEIYGYTIIRVLGTGAEAVVYEAVKNRTNIPIALKKYKKIVNMADDIPQEFQISKLLDHPHCLKLMDCMKNSMGEFIISMPLGTYGSLKYSDVPALTTSAAVLFLHQLGSALAHMHSRNVIHRDIKPGNILLNENGYCFCDYSVSLHLHSPDELVSGVIGTSVFMSCEISNTPYAPKPVDVWALGVTLYVLTFGKFPYNLDMALEQNQDQEWNNTTIISRFVSQTELTFPEIPMVPEEFKQILMGMLDKNPMTRLTAQQITENKWINEKIQERNNIMNYMINCESNVSMSSPISTPSVTSDSF